MAQIIAILGLKGSGKSTLAEMLVKALPGRSVFQPSLADPIKRGAATMFGIPSENLWGPSELRELPIPGFPDVSIRRVLTTLGTQWGRRYVDKDAWIKLLINNAEQLPTNAIVICPDVRFENEIRALHQAGAVVWRISREPQSMWRRFCNHLPFLYRIGDWLGLSPHQSEREMFYRRMDPYVAFEIDNSGTLEQLQATAKQLTIFVEPSKLTLQDPLSHWIET